MAREAEYRGEAIPFSFTAISSLTELTLIVFCVIDHVLRSDRCPFFSERIDATTRLADLTTFVQDNISPLLIETGRVTLPFSRESPPLLPSTHLHSLLALGCPSSICNCAHLTSAAALSIRALAANFLLLK